MDREKIKEAVYGLDPENDDHWIQSGLPSTEAVWMQGGSGDVKVTRGDISEAVGDYDRDQARSRRDGSGDGEVSAFRHPRKGSVAGSVAEGAKEAMQAKGGSERSSPSDPDLPDFTESTAAQETRAAAAVRQGLAGRHSAGDTRPFDLMDEFSLVTSAPEYRRNQIFQQIRTLWAQAAPEARAFQAKHDTKVAGREERMAGKRDREREAA